MESASTLATLALAAVTLTPQTPHIEVALADWCNNSNDMVNVYHLKQEVIFSSEDADRNSCLAGIDKNPLGQLFPGNKEEFITVPQEVLQSYTKIIRLIPSKNPNHCLDIQFIYPQSTHPSCVIQCTWRTISKHYVSSVICLNSEIPLTFKSTFIEIGADIGVDFSTARIVIDQILSKKLE